MRSILRTVPFPLPVALALVFGLGFGGMEGCFAAEPPLQLVVTVAPHLDATHGMMGFYERDKIEDGTLGPWRQVGSAVPVLFGKNGLAWGRGLHPEQPGLQKREGDGRAPAGRFAIGPVLGDAPELPPGAKWTGYVQMTDHVAWVDDPTLPGGYNHLYVVPPDQEIPSWFAKEQMKLHDPAHEWMVFIEHNYPEAVPGAGSAIFFHVRRGPNHPSFGCTVMGREELQRLVVWLDPARHPQLVQLAIADYARLWKEWDLPDPALTPLLFPSGK